MKEDLKRESIQDSLILGYFNFKEQDTFLYNKYYIETLQVEFQWMNTIQ